MEIVYNLKQIDKAVNFVLEQAKFKTLIFKAEMGTGKTTLIKQLVKALGCEDEVSSPTFSIVNEYITSNNDTIYHFDFYRINNEEEAYNKEQALRLQSAYDKLGPLLALDLQGNTPQGLNELWKETKGFRTELQKTLIKRAELTLDSESGNGVNTTPALRHYNPFSWEHN